MVVLLLAIVQSFTIYMFNPPFLNHYDLRHWRMGKNWWERGAKVERNQRGE
jgi:hypothetical protein